eukprot:COSAG04_NODE_3198_length_3061_cov_25.008778_5_plen_37_part_01
MGGGGGSEMAASLDPKEWQPVYDLLVVYVLQPEQQLQ